MHANVLEGRSGGGLGGPADLHEVLESPGAGSGDGEVEGSTPDTVDDSRLIKVLQRRQQYRDSNSTDTVNTSRQCRLYSIEVYTVNSR